VQGLWDESAAKDAFGVILGSYSRKSRRWDRNSFFRSGRIEVISILGQIPALGLRPGTASALDFGCGAGRLTQALCSDFDKVVGVDVSPKMISIARSFNDYPTRCSYLENSAYDLAQFRDSQFDFVLSELTLQHIPTRLARKYVGELVRVLAPGGVMVIQYPCETIARAIIPEVVHSALRRVLYDNRTRNMYGAPHPEVAEWISAAGGVVAKIERLKNPHKPGGVSPVPSVKYIRQKAVSLGSWTHFRYFSTKR
jgi:SAM-dependent methyltransferase